GPLEGTRFTFTKDPSIEQQLEQEVGNTEVVQNQENVENLEQPQEDIAFQENTQENPYQEYSGIQAEQDFSMQDQVQQDQSSAQLDQNQDYDLEMNQNT